MSLKQQVRQIGNKFLTHVNMCAQEAAYLILQMTLRNSRKSIVFVNTNEPGRRTFLLKPIESLQELPDSSTDSLKTRSKVIREDQRHYKIVLWQTSSQSSMLFFLQKINDNSTKIYICLPEDEREEINDDGIFQEMDTGQNNNEKEY